MSIIMVRFYFLLLLSILAFSSMLNAKEEDIGVSFKSHEAIYHLNMGQVTSSSKIHNVNGEMHLSVKFVCDGWIVNQNTTIDITDKNGSQLRNIFRYSTWESKNHETLRFISKVIINGEEVSNYEGKSYIKDGMGKIIFLKPHNKEINIPVNTLFPMKHFFISLYVNKVETFFNYIVFTGEDDQSLNNVSSFSKYDIYENNKYKIIRSAIYSYNDYSSQPENEIEILVNSKSGVVKKVIFDYLDYQIIGDLQDVQYYNEPEC